jgi:hypothetical protein
MTTDTTQYYGQTDPSTGQGDWNRQRFLIQQQMLNLNTSMPVQVISVQATGVAPVGFVNIQVMASQVTGDDKTVDHGIIPNVPYFRLQGGTNAVIIDPEPGDIGIANFCSRDISAVKNARQLAPPGSRRAYDFSDAMYSGGFLNKTPVQYIHFTGEGIMIYSPTAIKSEAPLFRVDAPTTEINSTVADIGNLDLAVLKLIDERIIQLYNEHTHILSPVPDVQLTPAMVATIHTKAN